MKRYPVEQTRPDYLRTQIERSRHKFGFCKVSARDVARYRAIVHADLARGGGPASAGPLLCLGTRNGREVDLFRLGFFGRGWRRAASRLLERQAPSFAPLLPPLEAAGRSRYDRIDERSVLGVEINPDAARPDVWIGSFDELPPAWTRRFGVVFSNSFDHSQDPARTAAEWTRVLRPRGYLILGFAERTEPTESDPVGHLTLDDLRGLFGGELIYFRERGSAKGYSEVVIGMGA